MSSTTADADDSRHEPTSTNFVPRYAGPSLPEMTPEQLSLRDAILSSRPRTGLSGPFGPWLSVPAIARPAQELGRIVRYGCESLTSRETELVILLTGARFGCEAEFDIHAREARAAGVGWETIRSIPRGATTGGGGDASSSGLAKFDLEAVKGRVVPVLRREHDEGLASEPTNGITRDEAREREVAIVLFASELLDTNTVSDETYGETRRILDGRDSALVEITAIVGYYALVSYTLNVFRIPSPA
ncbi:hypothetical protein ACHAW5_001197 [Stephanodiscus triporus]|uniref:Carboxymuconolactone decarboxylase-like domain-containing protein n=1 Tax=Stephanodiscus triporus TaxID=2934178 RepID=A0ABD3NGQ7_9STRA